MVNTILRIEEQGIKIGIQCFGETLNDFILNRTYRKVGKEICIKDLINSLKEINPKIKYCKLFKLDEIDYIQTIKFFQWFDTNGNMVNYNYDTNNFYIVK